MTNEMFACVLEIDVEFKMTGTPRFIDVFLALDIRSLEALCEIAMQLHYMKELYIDSEY